jgi:hypothetical protein
LLVLVRAPSAAWPKSMARMRQTARMTGYDVLRFSTLRIVVIHRPVRRRVCCPPRVSGPEVENEEANGRRLVLRAVGFWLTK